MTKKDYNRKLEQLGILGIYLGRNHATVVFMHVSAGQSAVIDAFTVSAEIPIEENETTPSLPDLIRRHVNEKNWNFSEVAIALDCSLFMQHAVISQFQDNKQLTATVQFDAEEQLATDASNIAVSFKIKTLLEKGSKLDVYTAEKPLLQEIITSFQQFNLDPITIEPDITCLSRFVETTPAIPHEQKSAGLFAFLSKSNGYIIAASQIEGKTQWSQRTFLIGQKQDRTRIIAREVPVTLSMLGEGLSEKVFYIDSQDTLDAETAGRLASLNFEQIQFPDFQQNEHLAALDHVELAVAAGAALNHREKIHTANFRNRFLPYMGRTIKLQKAAKVFSISAAALAIAIGIFGQIAMLQKAAPLKRAQKNFQQDYKLVMQGKAIDPRLDPVRKLSTELQRIENIKKGQLSATGEASVSAQLTAVLGAFNACAKQTNLVVDKITIHKNGISLIGKTTSRTNTLKLFESLKNTMDIQSQRIETKTGEDVFSVSVSLKK